MMRDESTAHDDSMAILTDVTRCIGCEACVKACQKANDLPEERPWRWLKRIDDLSSARWTTLRPLTGAKGENRHVRIQCRHCLDPECASVCIVGALEKTPEGPVVYHRDVCIGCRYCMIACPWEIPRYSWEDTVPYVQKCTFCYERVVKGGGVPACVEVCPQEATVFGTRKELLIEAHRRIDDAPDRYVNHVYGEHEVGGQSVLYLSDVELNLTDTPHPVRDKDPLPERTTRILHKMPMVFCAMAAVMGGAWWFAKRREKVAAVESGQVAEEGAAAAEQPPAEGEKETAAANSAGSDADAAKNAGPDAGSASSNPENENNPNRETKES